MEVMDPRKIPLKFTSKKINGTTWEYVYVPKKAGVHTVTIKVGVMQVKGSPYKVEVLGEAAKPKAPTGDPKKAYAKGPGVEPTGVVVGVETQFQVFTKDAGDGTMKVSVIDPSGKVPVEVTTTKVDEVTYTCTYTAKRTGVHTIDVKYGGGHIKDSPFKVDVGLPVDASKVWAKGRGIEPKGLTANEKADFKVFTKGAGQAELKVEVMDPDKKPVEATITKIDEVSYEVFYTPKKGGTYIVTVTYGVDNISKSPFTVEVASLCNAEKAYAKGKGIEPEGLKVNDKADFKVFTKDAGEGELKVEVTDSKKKTVTSMIKLQDKTTYLVTYTPVTVGKHIVEVTYGGKPIQKAPFTVNVDLAVDAKKAYAEGPGIEPKGVVANADAVFKVFTKDAGKAELKVDIHDPNKVLVKVVTKKIDETTYEITYVPKKQGLYTVTVTYGGKPIQKSPFKVEVSMAVDASKVYAKGPGIEPTGVKVNQKAEFNVFAKGAGEAELKVEVTDPEKKPVPATVKKSKEISTYDCFYEPKKPGKYCVSVTYGGKPIQKSPFMVEVAMAVDASKVYATGKGVEPKGLKVDEDAPFKVITKDAGDAELKVTVTNPENKPETCEVKKVDAETYECVYKPKVPGVYKVTITYGTKPIKNSPFKVEVEVAFDASKVYATGPGVEPKGLKVNQDAPFKVHTKDAGVAELTAKVTNPDGQTEPVTIKKVDAVTYDCVYKPKKPGKYVVTVEYGSKPIKKSPFTVEVEIDATKVYATGKGVEPTGPKAGEPAPFQVHTKDAGVAELTVVITNPDKTPEPCTITPKDNGVFDCVYTPKKPGKYFVSVAYGGKPISKSPFTVDVAPSFDASKAYATGKGIEPTGVVANQDAPFEVHTKLAGVAELTVMITGPDKTPEPCKVTSKPDGVYECVYTPKKPGTYHVSVAYGGQPIAKSPFTVEVAMALDSTKAYATGRGIEPTGVVANEEAPFEVHTKLAGEAELKVEVTGPDGKPEDVKIEKKPDGVYYCVYIPKKPGKYVVSVLFAGQHITKSPFSVEVTLAVDASRAFARGKGVEPKGVKVGEDAPFEVVTKNAGRAELQVTLVGPEGKPEPVTVKKVDEDTYQCLYKPVKPGQYTVSVNYGDQPITNSPFSVEVSTEEKPTDKRPYATGKGVEPDGPEVGENALFEVHTNGAPDANIKVSVTGPDGAPRNATVKKVNGSTYRCGYMPKKPGPHKVDVTYGGQPIKDSPFTVGVGGVAPESPVTPAEEPCNAFATGIGVEPKGPKAGKPAPFIVNAKACENAPLNCHVSGPGEKPIPLTASSKEPGIYELSYTPNEPGRHIVKVTIGGKPIQKSPFSVDVQPAEAAEDLIGQLTTMQNLLHISHWWQGIYSLVSSPGLSCPQTELHMYSFPTRHE